MNARGSGFRGGSGIGDTTTLPNPGDRGQFVDDLVSRFEGRRMGVDSAVVEFILQKVLVSDEDWARGWKKRRFDPARVAAKIEKSLELAADRADEAGALVIDVSLAEEIYDKVRKKRRGCVFPFRKC